MPDDTPIHEDTALVAVLTEQVGALNTLVTRFRLRANTAEQRAADAEARAEALERELSEAREAIETDGGRLARQAEPNAAPFTGSGEIAVSLDSDAPATKPIAADIDALDELLGEVRLL